MGVAGSGTAYDTKNGTLDYMVQDLLKTSDEKVFSEVKASRGVFNDVRQAISGWSSSAGRYYDKDIANQSKIMTDLTSISGDVHGLPAVIEKETTRSLVPVNKMQEQVAVISKSLPSMQSALDSSNKAILGLTGVVRQIYTSVSSIGQNKAPVRPETVSNVVNDFTPDYSNVLNNISDIIGSIRDNISGIDGRVDASTLYPGLHSDLDKIKDVIGELASTYSTSEGLDITGFTNAVQSYVGEFADDLVNGLVDELLPGMAENYAEFVTNFTSGFEEAIEKQSNNLVAALSNINVPGGGGGGFGNGNNPDGGTGVLILGGPVTESFNDWLNDYYDVIDQFHMDTITWLETLDTKLNKNFTTLNNTVRKSGASSKGDGLSDVIDSFDDSDTGSSISTGTSIVSNIWNLFKEYAPEVTGLLSWAHIKEHMDMLHADATEIIKQTGVTRKEALAMRTGIQQNIFSMYGMATTSKDDRQQAMLDALRAGMVSQEHLQQATEVNIATTKMLGTNFDFSNGFAKSLLTYRSNADDYLESVTLSLDTFSNNFYVSVDKLMASADKYVATANIFTKDFKGFSKSINAAIQAQAAQEAANIQSMDPVEFFREFAWTDMSNVSDAMRNRMALQFGVSGNELFKVRDILRAGGPEANALMSQLMATSQQKIEEQLKNVQAGGSAAEASLAYMGNVWSSSWEQTMQTMDEAQRNAHGQMSEDLLKDFSVPDSEAATREDIASRTQQAANLTELQALQNIAGAFEEGGVVKDIYNKLSELGISGSLVGAVGGFITSSLLHGIGGKLFGKGSGGIFSGLKDAFSGFGTKMSGLFSGFGTKLKDFTTGLGDKVKNFGSNLPKGLKDFGKFLASPANAKVEGYLAANAGATGLKGLGTRAVGALGSKASVGASTVQAIWDIGAGADKSQDWVGGEDYESKIAAGLGGALGGSGSGLGGAATGAIKWGAIGTAIAPGIGTAIGAALGGVAGAIGGERIAKGLKKASDFTSDLNDSIDVGLEEHLGVIGHGIGALKNTFIDWNKNILGGVYTGLGDFVGGLKDGGSKILHGDILGGLGDMGMGLVTGVKDIFMGPVNAVTDIIDDWSLSAEERINKRKGKLEDATKEAEAAQKKADAATDGINKALSSKHSDVTHTGKPIFTETKGRKGTMDASGLNSYSFADQGAEKILERNEPIEHTPGKPQTAAGLGLEQSTFINDLPNEDTVVKGSGLGEDLTSDVTRETDISVGEADVTENKPVLYGSKEYEEITNKPKTDFSSEVSEGAFTDYADGLKTGDSITENTTALQELTSTIKEVYGIVDNTENTSDVNSDMAWAPVKNWSEEMTNEASLIGEKKGDLYDTILGGLSHTLGSGLYGVTGVVASKIIDSKFRSNDAPEKEKSFGFGDLATMSAKTGLFGTLPMIAGNVLDSINGFVDVNPLMPAVDSGSIPSNGAENISAPIVDALNTNMTSVIALLTKMVNSTSNQGNVNPTSGAYNSSLATRSVNLNADDTNSNDILNHQKISS